MHIASFLPFAALLAVAAVALAAAPGPKEASGAGALEAKCDKEADAIKVTAEGGKTILSVSSKSGIGGATIERKAEHWPEEVILRLYLSGLERFAITSGELRLSTSVASHDGSMKRLELWKGNEECPLDKTGPYWMDIRVLDAAGKPIKGLPPKGGWFEMKVPKGLLGDKVKVITLGWIDFYRR